MPQYAKETRWTWFGWHLIVVAFSEALLYRARQFLTLIQHMRSAPGLTCMHERERKAVGAEWHGMVHSLHQRTF
jgi:hypothetical protein